MIGGGSETLAYAAEALILQGDLDGAEQQLEQAFAIVSRYGERIYLPQLLLVQGAVARTRGKAAAADASVRRAVEESRAQQAPWLEMLALTDLSASSTAKSGDRRALGALVAELAEASDAPAYARAKAVLECARK
jgi:hypothetical protein